MAGIAPNGWNKRDLGPLSPALSPLKFSRGEGEGLRGILALFGVRAQKNNRA
jgi:hypothetical protein